MSDFVNNPQDWFDKSIAEEYITLYEFSDFNNLQPIGRGSFGSVFRANWKNTDTIFAIKKFNNNNSTPNQVVNEVKLQKRVDFHENIIRFHGIIIEKETDQSDVIYSLVLEYADSGTLSTYLNEHFNELEWNDKYRLSLQLASAVACIMNVHADNIFIHQKKIKVADFGLSRKISSSSNPSNLFGAIRYMDPKALNKDINYKINKKSDVYSVGILMWQISSGYPPFSSKSTKCISNDERLTVSIVNGKREEIIDGTPVKYSNLYTECWRYESNERPNMQDVVLKLKTMFFSEQQDIIIDATNKKVDNLFETHGLISESTIDLNNKLMTSNRRLNISNIYINNILILRNWVIRDPSNDSTSLTASVDFYDSIFNKLILFIKLIIIPIKKYYRGYTFNQIQQLINQKKLQLNQLNQEIDNPIIKKLNTTKIRDNGIQDNGIRDNGISGKCPFRDKGIRDNGFGKSLNINNTDSNNNYEWYDSILDLFKTNGYCRLSPFSKMILNENDDNIYDDPVTEAIINFPVSWAYLNNGNIINGNLLLVLIFVFCYLAVYQLITEVLQFYYHGPKNYFGEIFNILTFKHNFH
ncbi:kinase-like protein [Rhizophagus irregularis]|uniref:Kinase-like protein n=1 Tax=Rhizophagus irregularis TaxID=588596 RepID=A0A2I1HBC0_9GLOM|nr:kinase-like protein [Rhizophagus irregularis]